MRRIVLVALLLSVRPSAEPRLTDGLDATPTLATPASSSSRVLAVSMVDGAARADATGSLIADEQLRWLFEHILSEARDDSPDVLRRWVAEHVNQRLSVSAATQAVSLFGRYLAYRQATERANEVAHLRGRLELLRALRRQHLGEDVARAFFEEEEHLDELAIGRHELEQRSNLSDEERERADRALVDRLPAHIRRAQEQVTAPLNSYLAEQRLRAAGATPEQIQALRRETLGAATVSRLDALDRQRAEWEARVSSYATQKRALEARHGKNPTVLASELDKLLAERFAPHERLRIAALERIAQSTAR